MSTDTTSDWDAPADEDFELDGGGMSSDDVATAQGEIDRLGWYHFDVADVVPELETVKDGGGEKAPAMRFDLVALQTVNGQSPAGSKHFHRIYVGSKGGGPPADGSRDAAFRFGLGLGLLVERKEGDKTSIVDAVSGGKPNKATYMRAKGFQFLAKLGMSKAKDGYEAKIEIAYGSTIYIPNDPSAKDMGINEEAWALAANHSSQQPPPADKSKAKPAPKAPAETETAVDPVDELADL